MNPINWSYVVWGGIGLALVTAVISVVPEINHQLTYGERYVTSINPVPGSADAIIGTVSVRGVVDDGVNYLGYISAGEQRPRWELGPWVSPDDYPAVLIDGPVAYTVFSDTVRALNVADGSQRWQSRVDTPMNVCTRCLLIQAGRLVVLTQDLLTGIDPATGTVAWRLPMRESVRRITPLTGDQVAVAADGAIFVVASGDGQVVREIATACDNYPAAPMPPGMDPLLIVDGSDLFLRLGFCVQRIDLTTGAKVWEAQFERRGDGALSNFREYHGRGTYEFMRADEWLYASLGNTDRTAGPRALARVAMSDGRVEIAAEAEDTYLIPYRAVDDVVLVQARPVIGLTTIQLWALDVADNRVRWTYVPERFGEWEVLPASLGLAFVQLQVRSESEAQRPFLTPAVRSDLYLDVLDPQTGTRNGTEPVSIPIVDNLFLNLYRDATPTEIFINTGSLLLVDLDQRRVEARWP